MKTGKRLLSLLLSCLIVFGTTGAVKVQGQDDLQSTVNIEESMETDPEETEMQEAESEETADMSEESEGTGDGEEIISDGSEIISEEPEEITPEETESENESSDDILNDGTENTDGLLELEPEETDQAEAMAEELVRAADDSIQISSFSVDDGQELNTGDDSGTYGGKMITVTKSWKGDEATVANRPDAVTFELYASNSDQPIDTITLTGNDAVTQGGSTWKGTFDKCFPVYDVVGNEIRYSIRERSVTAKDIKGNDQEYLFDNDQTVTYQVYRNGSLIESPIYRYVQDRDDTTTVEGYENVSVFVPVTELEEGTDYLVAGGNSGNINIYRAEAYQTDKMIATADGDVSVVTNGRIIQGINSDGTKKDYRDYILIADEETGAAVGEDGRYLTDYMTWRAEHVENNTGVLVSNFYRLCGLVENNDEEKYPGYLSTEKDRGYGLCVYKNKVSSLAEAPQSAQFSYDSASGGFRTPGSDKVVYLYKKISLVKGTLERQTETFGFTNWKNLSSSDDPMDTGETSEPEPYTNVTVSKVWTDGKSHDGEKVTIALLANGTEEKELTVSADTDWKGTFSSLPSQDSDGNEITYTVAEKSVKDSSGNNVSYISTVEDTTDPEKEKSKIWLPVDRPSKKDGGEDYIVIAFPTSKSEIGQNIWGNGFATRKALTSNAAGTKFAMGSKNSGNTDGASMDVVITEGPVTVGGKTYSNYITDGQAHNADGSLRTTIMWRVGYVGTASASVASHADYGPWPRNLFYFKALAGKGGYLSTQGSMTLEKSIDIKKFENNRGLFAYGMMYSSEWKSYDSMTKQGYTQDQITHMIGAMDHYALRSDKSPGQFGESDCTYPAMYLYKGVEVTNKSYTVTNTAKKTVHVKKVWKDKENKDNRRPSRISVELFRNGTGTGKLLYLSQDNEWEGTFRHLDAADAKDDPYTYSVKEHISDYDSYDTEYKTETDENGNLEITITNTLKDTLEIPVSKVWADGNEKHSGTKVEIQLLADGTAYKDGKAELSEENNWKYIYKNLPKYKEDGRTEIRYTVEETKVSGYTASIEGDITSGFVITNTPVLIVMPETGATGRFRMILSGIGLLAGGILLMINKKKENGGTL